MNARAVEELERLIAPLRGHRVLLGLDVDGTLVDHEGVMDPAVHDALHAVREAGHHVVIATGRSLGATLPIVELAGVTDGWAVSSNGAVLTRITGTDTHEVTDTITFDPEAALRTLYKAVPTARFAIERRDGTFVATQSFQEMSFGLEAVHAPIEDLFKERDVVRVVVTAPDMSTAEFTDVVARAGVHGCQYAIGWSSWLDMSAPGVTKASALEALRQRLGVDSAHTLTVGDGSNDVEMLEWAGVGIAMGQAGDNVRKAANAVTLTVEEHGAAHVLQLLASRRESMR